VVLEAEKRWGTAFYTTLSKDLMQLLPGVKGLSVKNLYYMKKYYQLVNTSEFFPQAVGKIGHPAKRPQLVDESGDASPFLIFPQVVGNPLEPFFSIPWGHIRIIIDKCGEDQAQGLFYARKTMENNWSRDVLLNFLDTRLYERQGRAVTNFWMTLPKPQSDLAQQITRDPYLFDFIAVREQYDEKELKDTLMDNIQHFLLEMGNGFALLGREYRLMIGNTEQFLDFLFYHAKLHCYIVVEVKTRKLDAGDMGQLGTYVAAVNGILKQDNDAPTIGLLICKTKDNVMAQYASSAVSVPIGISEYELSKLMPEEYKGSLPTIEEIEAELKED
jgi:predicted nuclease of restriction endonuclease-like (RecB) superfamily